jgi:hypothetical protein
MFPLLCNSFKAVSEDMLNVWLTHVTSQPRSASILGWKGSNTIVSSLKQAMQRYLSDVKVTHLTADKRDREFVFFDQSILWSK